jgi:catechol 2,3-dioxygenase-like lactoylglutathione lyase family enzyme
MTVLDMEHVLVLSDDIDGTKDFYCRVVGLEVGARPPLEFRGYWLYAGDVPCVHIAERGPYLKHAAWLGLSVAREPPGASAVDHIAFNAIDYDAVCTRVEQAGVVAIRNSVPGAGLRQLFIEDPNGVRVEINVRGQTSKRGSSDA